MSEYYTSERFELVLQVKFLSSQPGQVNAEIGTDGILLKRPAHLVDSLHHSVWRWAYHTKTDIQSICVNLPHTSIHVCLVKNINNITDCIDGFKPLP